MRREFTLEGKDGKKLYARVFEAEQPRAVICVSHGLGEHGERYAELAKVWNGQGYSVYVHDQRGHGKSVNAPKERGIARMEELESDFLRLIERAGQETGLPVFLLGHSLGGLIGLYTAFHGKPAVRGALITSPWLILQMHVPAPVTAAVGGLGRVLKNASIANGINANNLCKDAAICEAYTRDPLNHDRIGFGLFADATKAARWVLSHPEELEVPLLLCHGDSDPICSVEGSRALAKQEKIKYVEFPGEYHELHHEPTAKEKLVAAEIAFMDALL